MAQAQHSQRTLEADHRVLAALLRPGLSVLDVGCGRGAITLGIAQAVQPGGRVIGVDRDPANIEFARRQHAHPNLEFIAADAGELQYRSSFDVATSARTLQWTADPAEVLYAMTRAVKPGGAIVALDYNMAANRWDPPPPPEFAAFYTAFLAWRVHQRFDNWMADHLPDLFPCAGLLDIEAHPQNEIATRGEPAFAERAAVWSWPMEHFGTQIVADGFLSPDQLRSAQEAFAPWVEARLMQQTLVLRAAVGRVP